MEVKVLPFRVKSDSLSDHAETNHQSEAGIRAESEVNQINHTAANREILWCDSFIRNPLLRRDVWLSVK
jgi:hypothetical protein